MSTVPFVSLAELKEYLTISSTNFDAKLSNLITTGCAVVERYIGTEVLSNNYTEIFDGGKPSIFTSRLPLNTVHMVEEYNGSEYVPLLGPNYDSTYIDNEAHIHQITFINGNLSSRYKKFGKNSINFNANTSLSIQNNEDFWIDAQDFTIEMQVRLSNANNSQSLYTHSTNANTFISLYTDQEYGLNLRYTQNDIDIFKANGSSNTITSTYLLSNTWTHISAVKSNDDVYLFINGTLINNVDNNSSVQVIEAFTNSIKIGGTDIVPLETCGSNVIGQIDEIRISNFARYTANFTPSNYRFNTDERTVFLCHCDDSSLKDVHASKNEYDFDPETGSITKLINFGDGNIDISVIPNNVFYNGKRAVKVTYNAGYTSAPSDLKLATMDYIKMLHKQTQENNTNILQGEHANKYPLSANFPPHVRRILDLYRIIM